MNTLSEGIHASIQHQYLAKIKHCRNLIRYNEITGQRLSAKTKVDAYIQTKRAEAKIYELTKMKAPINKNILLRDKYLQLNRN